MNLTDLHLLSEKRYNALQKEGISTPMDLLYFIPRRYVDKSNIVSIIDSSFLTEPVTVIARVKQVNVVGRGYKKRLDVLVSDDTASMSVVFFKGWKYFITQFKEGEWVMLHGPVKRFGNKLSMAHPEVDRINGPEDAQKSAKILPVYPSGKSFSKASITNKLIAGWVNEILNKLPVPEFIPPSLLKKNNLPERKKTFATLHQPEDKSHIPAAKHRLKYEELFLFSLSMAKIKSVQQSRSEGTKLEPGPLTKIFFNELLPFALTKGQKTALSDVRTDLKSGLQMNRLIQGDVGAGKTVVAIGAMLMAADNGMQAALMAPTEILAEQHYQTINTYLQPLRVNFRLLTGGQSTSLRRDVLSDIAGGTCHIAVGTHAIFQEKVQFNNLGLAVIDEQHRFGVKQRNEMLMKGEHPHLLVMSATPIPRSLAMTIYSDLDISVIKDLPGGRKPIKTAVRTDKDRDSVYDFIYQSVQNGDQAYIVYPLIEESEALDLKDATMGFEKLKRRFPELSISLLHGQMKPDEKEAIMKRFSSGDTDILVSTTVIEVGVDVPNASIMVIEHAERFGLSQLHQLRGRIGRGTKQSYCILMPGSKLSKDGRYRLRKMVETTDGFEIAEADLKLRGPGDFMGTKQSGLPDFRFADIVEDKTLLEQAKQDAWSLIGSDPNLNSEQHQNLNKVFEPYFKKRAEFFGVG